MKKLFTLLLIILSAFAFKSEAQNNPNCNAAFNYSITGLSVQFTADITSNATANHHYWKFGDGNISSDVSPVHLYASGGTYTVTHIFYRSENGVAACIDSVKKRIEVKSPTISCNLLAKFSFERDPSQPNKIKFTNLSTPADDVNSVKWSFGDGTYSDDFNTSHVYSTSGLYKVCLIVKKDNSCQRDVCINVQVQAPPPCNVAPNFVWHSDNVQFNKIYFSNLSSHFEPNDLIRWTFGDGTSSTDVNPTHTYTSAGTYNVCIRIQKNNAAGTAPCIKEICKKVIVENPCELKADFSFEADATNKNKINFKNLSTPVSSVSKFQWTFGDGASSNAINPDHIYAHPGTYKVCLKISGSNTCYREICKTVEIKESEINCHDISKFNLTRSALNCLEFKFTPVVQNPNWKYVWTFGDGTGSTDMNPVHVFAGSGKYNVSLTVYKSSTCASTSQKIAETGACFNCNNTWLKYEYKREAATSNKIYFHALSNHPIVSQTWVITKLSLTTQVPVILVQNNPVYVFNEPGDYRVCLKTVTAGGCVKEYCDVIHIASSNTNCVVTAYPNPTHSQVSIAVQMAHPEMIHVYIFNSLNILVKQKDQQGNAGNNIVTTNIEGLIPGWYSVKIVYGNRICYSRFQKI